MYSLKAHRTAITVFILSMNHVIRGGEFPPDELVEKVIESRNQTKLCQHFMHLTDMMNKDGNYNIRI